MLLHNQVQRQSIACCEAAKEGIWICMVLEAIRFHNMPISILVDNTSAIRLAEDAPFSNRTKHIEVRYHKFREWVTNDTKHIEVRYHKFCEWVTNDSVCLDYVSTKNQAADCLTKIVDKHILINNLSHIGVVGIQEKNLKKV